MHGRLSEAHLTTSGCCLVQAGLVRELSTGVGLARSRSTVFPFNPEGSQVHSSPIRAGLWHGKCVFSNGNVSSLQRRQHDSMTACSREVHLQAPSYSMEAFPIYARTAIPHAA